jgi:type III pantothenate kinase
MSGGAYAIAGAVQRMARRLHAHAGTEPALLMTGGAAPKLRPITDLPFEVVDSLIFDGLLRLAAERVGTQGG